MAQRRPRVMAASHGMRVTRFVITPPKPKQVQFLIESY
jgi:hypothetical protein